PRPPISPLFPYTTLFRSHAIEAIEKGVAVLLVKMDDNLGVGMVGAKAVSGRDHLRAQFYKVVDLAVEDDGDSAVFVEHWLLTSGDRKSTRLNSSHLGISY